MSEPAKLRLGGMALRNGLLVHGPTHWAAAIRGRDGEIQVASGRKPRVRGRVGLLPGTRGVARLGEAFVVIPLVKRALPEAKLPFQDARVLGVAGLTAAAGAFARRRSPGLSGEAVSAGLSLAPALFALRIGEIAEYHGVEHKSIAAYEEDRADAADASKEHDRCGSNLVAPMLVANIAGAALVKKVVPRPGPVAGAAVALGAMGTAVEIFLWSERHSDTGMARALRRPGFELQRVLGTREPDAEQMAVGQAALQEILRVEAAPAAR